MAVYPERRKGRLTGKWIAEVTQAGERRRKRFDSQRDGQRWADFIKVTGSAPADAEPEALGPTLDTVVKEALEHHPGWAQGRDPNLEQRIAYVLDTLGRDTPIADIQTQDLNRLVASLRKRPGRGGRKLGPATINRYLSAISAALTYAKKQARYIDAVPTVPWQKEEGKRLHWLDQDEEDAVAAAMPTEEDRLTLHVLTTTGMRWGEFASLEPKQIDGPWVKLDRTKTDRPRDVPIDPALGERLKDMIGRKAVPRYYTFRRCLIEALKSAGQNENVTIHSLRHSTASRLVQAGETLGVVKDFLGHNDIKTTLKYTHVTPSKLQDAAKKLSPQAGQSGGSVVNLADYNQVKYKRNQADDKIGPPPVKPTWERSSDKE